MQYHTLTKFYCCLILVSITQLYACSGNHQPDPKVKEPSPFERALRKAEKFNREGAFVQAEIQARAALTRKPEDQKARMVLFTSLSQQSTKRAQKEAAKLARELKTSYPPDSPEGKSISKFLNKLEVKKS